MSNNVKRFESVYLVLKKRAASIGDKEPGFSSLFTLLDGEQKSVCAGSGSITRESKLTSQTIYPIALVTKCMVAAATLRLCARRSIALDLPLTNEERFVRVNSDLSIIDLLTHHSGVPDYLDSYDEHRVRSWSFTEAVAVCTDLLQGLNNSRPYLYSNSNYILLGYLLECWTGQSFEEVLKNEVFKPLNLSNTVCWSQRFDLEIELHRLHERTFTVQSIDRWALGWSDGCVLSNADDINLFVQAIMKGGFLPDQYKSLMGISKQKPKERLAVGHLEDNDIFFQCGSTTGSESIIAYDNYGCSVVILVNFVSKDSCASIINEILNLLEK